jgi:nitrite reductase (NO-forming)
MPAGNCPEMQTITEDDRALIRDWVDQGAPLGVASTVKAVTKEDRVVAGKRLFTLMCATCHQSVGQGVTDKYPPLAGSDFLNEDKERAIKILLYGRTGPIVVNGKNYNNTMPQFTLSDDDIANALSYTYNSFGNSGKDVTPAEVKAVRAQGGAPASAPAAAPAGQFE